MKFNGCRFVFMSNTDHHLYRLRHELLHALVQAGADVVALVPAGDFSDAWQRIGVKHHAYAAWRGSSNPLRVWQNYRQLRAMLARLAPDLLHTYTAQANTLGTLAARLNPAVRVVNTVTGAGTFFIDHPSFRRRAVGAGVRALYRMSSPYAHCIVFQNPDDRSAFVNSRLTPPDRTRIIRSAGVNTSEFRVGLLSEGDRSDLRRSLTGRDDAVIVLMVARLLRDKGVMEYAQAARALVARDPRLVFLLAGEPDYGNFSALTPREMTQLAETPGLRLLGHREDIAELLGAADIFALPSYREGAPRSVLEAMAAGLPIVTTDAPGCRELVRASENGFLVPVRSAAGLAAALETLADQPGLRAEMGAASRRIAVEEFSVELINQQHLDLYSELLAS